VANGLFADQGLEVELLDPAGGPENVQRVAGGGADFCLTSVAHYLGARAAADDLAARFVAVVVQRSPMAGLVVASSDLTTPSDLSGRRIGGRPDGALVADYQASLVALGFEPATVVPMDYGDAPAALGRGEIDAVADFIDLVPRTRRQAGVPVRGVHLGPDVYGSGLVAADRVPDELAGRMRDAIVAALEHQRDDPEPGLAALLERYPDVDAAEALEGWSLAVPNIFTGAPPGSMQAAGWQATVDFLSSSRGRPAPAPETVYRPAFADRTAAVSTSTP
jgi:ABC-type nitrate/sulfonate/bicarbonate transport system substrate-binding protein